jgi:hypothetical protein
MMLSESQYKLAALLVKTKDVLPFATDAACDDMFVLLADFARDMMSENERRKGTNYEEMNLEDLLQLTTPGLKGRFFLSFRVLLIGESRSSQGKRQEAG